MDFTNTLNQAAPLNQTPVLAVATAPPQSDSTAPADPTVVEAAIEQQDLFQNLLNEMALQDFLFEDEIRRVAARFTMRSNCQEASNDTVLSIIGLQDTDDDDDVNVGSQAIATSNFTSALGLPTFDINSLLGFSAS